MGILKENTNNLDDRISYLFENESFNDFQRKWKLSNTLEKITSSIEEAKALTIGRQMMHGGRLKMSTVIFNKELAEIELSDRLKDLEDEISNFKDFPDDRVIRYTEPVTVKEAICVEAALNSINLDDLEFEDTHLMLTDTVRTFPISGGMEVSYDSWYASFLVKLEAVRNAKKLLRALTRQVNFLLNLVKKRLRNLRQVFTKLHSFHFKNLDDYHSTDLNLSF